VPLVRVSCAAAALLAAAASQAAAAAPLPNLVQEPPSALAVRQVEGRWHLAFTSTVDNLGSAALVVVATRASRSTPTMEAFQLVGGARVARVGSLRYVVDPTHEHWHLRPFERFELRRAADGALVGAARKAGFCLTDSRRVRPNLPGLYRARCGLKRPDALRLREGISAGWADVYGPEREGQFVDVTGVPAGRYALVNRVDGDGRMRETSYADDVAATFFDLSWPDGATAAPALSVVGVCLGVAQCVADGIR
jgi:hypothetical protein